MLASHARTALLAAARAHTAETNPFTYYLGRVLIPADRRPLFYAWYAYFRWIDDLIDEAGHSIDENRQILDRQIELLERLYADREGEPPIDGDADALLELLAADDRLHGSSLRGPIRDMLTCIRYDATRIGQMPPREELDRYIEREVSSYLRAILAFCCPRCKVDDLPTPYEGIAGKWSHILRDLISDLEHGMVNISREDGAAYGIEPDSLGEPGLIGRTGPWVAAKVDEAERQFRLGRRRLHRNPCLRYKLAVGVLCAKYEYYLARIREDRFLPRRGYGGPSLAFLFGRTLSHWLAILFRHYLFRSHKGRLAA